MKYIPHPYQQKAIDFVEDRQEAALFMDMGLGKTSVILSAFNDLKYDCAETEAILVVAPLRVTLLTWAQEAAKWDHLRHLRVKILHGKDKAQTMRERADVYVINYDGLAWLRDQLTKRRGARFPQRIDMIVYDESTYVKNGGSKRSKIAAGLAAGVNRKVILTGTPTPNGLIDMWHQIYLLDGGERLGPNISNFRGQYFTYNEFSRKYFPRPGVPKWVTDQIGDLALTMQAEDYLDMPALMSNRVETALPDKYRAQYEEFEQEFFINLDGWNIKAFDASALSMKLRQYVQGFVYREDSAHDVHTEKIEALQEIVAGSGSPVLVAIQFRHEARMIEAAFGDVPVIYGGTSTKDTVDYVCAWNSGKLPLLIVHPASMSHGVNLQHGGHTIAWFGITWNLEHYLQLNARLYRQGQEHPVMVHHIIMKDTIDEAVMSAIENKEESMAGLLGRLKEWNNSNLKRQLIH